MNIAKGSQPLFSESEGFLKRVVGVGGGTVGRLKGNN